MPEAVPQVTNCATYTVSVAAAPNSCPGYTGGADDWSETDIGDCLAAPAPTSVAAPAGAPANEWEGGAVENLNKQSGQTL